jgi:hypothetical protein
VENYRAWGAFSATIALVSMGFEGRRAEVIIIEYDPALDARDTKQKVTPLLTLIVRVEYQLVCIA